MPLRELLSRSSEPGRPPDGEGRSGPLRSWLDSLRDAERELWFVATAAMLVDVTLTVHGLNLGLEERNPAAVRAMDVAGVLGLYGLKSMALFIGLSCRPLVPARANAMIPILLAIPSVLAVAANATLLATVLL